MSRAINYLSIARKAGELVTGEENAGMAVRAGRARLLVLAADASDNARARAQNFLRGGRTPWTVLPLTKQEISDATGRNGCSMAVFTDIGLACSFAEAIYAEYGGEYGELAAELRRRNDKATQRRKETLAHRRNRKQGKRRSNV